MRMLIADDDFISRQLLCRYLKSFGKFEVAANGREAVDAVKLALDEDNPFDLICLDISMPCLDGQQALQKIRECEYQQNIMLGDGAKVIMTTASNDRKNIIQAFRNTCDGYTIKPIDKSKFYRTLKRIGLDMPVDVTEMDPVWEQR